MGFCCETFICRGVFRLSYRSFEWEIWSHLSSFEFETDWIYTKVNRSLTNAAPKMLAESWVFYIFKGQSCLLLFANVHKQIQASCFPTFFSYVPLRMFLKKKMILYSIPFLQKDEKGKTWKLYFLVWICTTC